MIQQLRKKFILVAMGSMFAVLAVIIGVLNAVNYINTVQGADRILTVLSENNGRFPDDFPDRKERLPDRAFDWPRELHAGAFRGMSEETPFETRFFSVRLNAAGEVVSVDTGRIAAVETADAIAYSRELYADGREKGFYKNYRFLSEAVAGSSDRRMIFVDCSRDMRNFYSILRNSIGVALLGLAAVFVLVLYFSQKVFRPVEESYEKQRMFVTDASHELKTPLTIISANVDILEMEGGESRWTGSIRNQVKRLRNLTEQMVTLSRMEEQRGAEMTEFALSRAVEETAEGFRPLALERNKELQTEIEKDIVYRGDESRICQMTGLLLDNALKYSGEKGVIRLKLESCRRKGYKVQMIMWNTVGAEAGLTAGRQDKLFERFYRPDASRSSQTGGSGIGLSIVKAIVELHKGKITAESGDGTSIQFTVFL